MFWFLPFAAVAAAAAAVAVLRPGASPADPPKTGGAFTPPPAAAAVPAETSVQLPIGQVVLFSSGVGYFQREGQIEGDARVDLSFPVSDINDLIKSMVLRDLDGGHVSAVSYDSNAPVEKTLNSFAIKLTGNPGFGQILNQARGEKVEAVLQQANAGQPGTLTGSVMGVETQQQPAGKDNVVNVEVLNVWCADGMRAVKLADVQRVRFLNPIMDNEVRKALETLTLSHDTQKKAVSLNFTGEGKRNVRVGYVIENPIWKTSYRMVLSKAKEEKPFLQGWAVVENATDEDWKDVRMALVSGRPISFMMDLYTPLYVPRPTVVPELFASLQPRTYSGTLTSDLDMAAEKKPREGAEQAKEEPTGPKTAIPVPGEPPIGIGGGLGGFGPGLFGGKLDDLKLNQGVSSIANATKLGDYFQYAIDNPVSLPRQKSALLPILNKDVEGTRVSIYNEAVQAKFPLHGLRFKNTSGVHLMQGPVTVYEKNNYAGDAQVRDLEPNEETYLSYAIDLGTEVNPVPQPENGRLTKVKVVKGILWTVTKQRETKTYEIKNRNEDDRRVVVEHPYRPEFRLMSEEKPLEKTRDTYRFEVAAPAGKLVKLDVVEERDVQQTVQLTNSDDDSIRFFVSNPVSSRQVKDALQKALDLRAAVYNVRRDLDSLNHQLKDITDDQARLRANLKEMPQTAAAYKRYLDKFDKQETEIEKLHDEMKKLQDEEAVKQADYEDYLSKLDVE
jgi:hypothetical protein